jgi:2-C-methyl-D-erythritol 2,4-cyclodiphosphate synthase
MKIRIGQGIDFHRLEDGLPLWLGGIAIPSDKGCVAHSDGDVLIHAICDALLGAAGLRDIGFYFPDTSNEYKNIDSKILLRKTHEFIREKGFDIENIDCTICLEKPKLSPYIPEMIKTIALVLSTDHENIAIKATTTEKLGFIGREEGIAAFASALISKSC